MIDVHPIVLNWSACMLAGLAACFAIAVVQESITRWSSDPGFAFQTSV
jgi:hypothetical protein